ncbi:MAG: hypothetical protein K6C95_11430 [Lachnospiraceae bacterium]|nr:hypothetical protein [Lachnospiraceae bacterium]
MLIQSATALAPSSGAMDVRQEAASVGLPALYGRAEAGQDEDQIQIVRLQNVSATQSVSDALFSGEGVFSGDSYFQDIYGEDIPEEDPVNTDDIASVDTEAADTDVSEEDEETPRGVDDWLYSDDDFITADNADVKTVTANMKGNERIIFRYLTEVMDLNTAAACGVLANICCESGFKTWSVGDGGTSYGICQWHNGRKRALLDFLKKRSMKTTSLAGQLKYMENELVNGSYRGVYDYLKGVSDTATGAYNAGGYFCMYYEIPANRSKAAVSRGNLARNTYWAAYAEGINNASVLVKTPAADVNITAKTASVDVFSDSAAADIGTDDENDILHDVFDDQIDEDVEEDSLPERVWVLGLEEEYEYLGDSVKPDIRVYDGVTLLTKNEDYKVAYQKNDRVGTAKIRITLTDSGEEYITSFRIVEPSSVLPAGFSRALNQVPESIFEN